MDGEMLRYKCKRWRESDECRKREMEEQVIDFMEGYSHALIEGLSERGERGRYWGNTNRSGRNIKERMGCGGNGEVESGGK